MKPILFEQDALDYSSNGIGVLHDAILCEVTEDRNGEFSLEMEYPTEGDLFSEIDKHKLILAKPNDKDEPHIFRIFETDKDLDEGVVYISAMTITDDLSGNLVLNASVAKARAQLALDEIKNKLIEPTHFDFVSDIETEASSEWTRINPLQAIAGVRGSLVDLWGGEIKRTNNTVFLYSRRGRDKVTTIRPGKNIQGFNMVVSTKGMVTRILPYLEYTFHGLTEYEMVRDHNNKLVKQTKYSDRRVDVEPTVILGDVVVSEEAEKYPVNWYDPIDFSSDEELTEKINDFIDKKEKEIDESPTVINTSGFEKELQDYVKGLVDTRAKGYFTYDNPGIDKPKVEMKVDILQLSDSPEWEKYKNLEHIGLTDTVEVYVKKFDVDVEVKIGTIVYDSIGERVVRIVAGSSQSSLSQSNAKEYQDATSKIEKHINTVENGIQNRIDRTADGLNRKFTGYTEPSADIASEGDLWFKLLGEGRIETYIFNGGQWIPVISDEVFEAIEQDVVDAVARAEEAYQKANQATADAEESIVKAEEGFLAAQQALGDSSEAKSIAQKAENDILEAEKSITKAQADADAAGTRAEQAIADSQLAFNKASTNEATIGEFAIRIGENEDNYTSIAGTVGGLQTEVSKKVNTTTYNSKMTQLDNVIQAKMSTVDADKKYATQSSLTLTSESLTSEIEKKVDGTTYSSKMTQLDNLISTKISETSADGKYATQSSLTQTKNSLQSEITKKVDGTVYNSKMTQLEGLISTKISEESADGKYATQTSLTQTKDSLTSEITKKVDGTVYSTKMTQLDNAIASKISVKDADGKYTAMTTFTQTIDGIQSEVSKKVNTTTYNSKMTQLDNVIQTKMTTSDANSKFATQSSLTQTSNSLVSKIETIEGWEFGGRNLLENSNKGWLETGITTIPFPGSKLTPYEGEYITISLLALQVSGTGGKFDVYLRSSGPVKGSRSPIFTLKSTGTTFSYSFKVTKLMVDDTVTLAVRANGLGGTDSITMIFSNIKIERGNKPSDWSPAPEDKADTSYVSSQISQLQGSINLRVTKNDVVNQLNIDSSGVLIQGKKIQLDGNVSVLGTFKVGSANIKDASIGSAQINTIDAAKITSGEIDGNRITLRGGNANDYAEIKGSTIELRGRYRREFQGVTTTHDIRTRLHHGHLRFRNDVLQRSLYMSEFGISTYLDGEGEIGSSGSIFWWDTEHSPTGQRGITVNSYGGTAALVSEKHHALVKSLYSTSIESTDSNITLSTHTGASTKSYFTFTKTSDRREGYILYGLNNTKGLRFGYGNAPVVEVVDKDNTTGGNTEIQAGIGRFNYMDRRPGNNYLSFIENNTDWFAIGSDGIGRRVTSYAVYNRTYSQGANMYITSAGTFGRATSALKYKTDVEPIEEHYAYNFFNNVTPVFYRPRNTSDEDMSLSHYGYIADYVAPIEPRLVQFGEYGQPESFNYDRVPALLHVVMGSEFKTIREEYEELKDDFYETREELVLKIADLEDRIQQLEVA